MAGESFHGKEQIIQALLIRRLGAIRKSANTASQRKL